MSQLLDPFHFQLCANGFVRVHGLLNGRAHVSSASLVANAGNVEEEEVANPRAFIAHFCRYCQQGFPGVRILGGLGKHFEEAIQRMVHYFGDVPIKINK
jgi:hypothetical protein